MKHELRALHGPLDADLSNVAGRVGQAKAGIGLVKFLKCFGEFALERGEVWFHPVCIAQPPVNLGKRPL